MELKEKVLNVINLYPDALTTVAGFRVIYKHSFKSLSLALSNIQGIKGDSDQIYSFLIEQSKRFSSDGAFSSDSKYSTIREGSNGWVWLADLVCNLDFKVVIAPINYDKDFKIDKYPYDSVNRIFSVYPEDTMYFSGSGPGVQLGYFVYLDEKEIEIFKGNSKYYAISSTEWIKIDDRGIVIDKGLILEDVPFIMEVEIPTDNFDFVFQRSSQNTSLPQMQFTNAFVDYGDGTIDNWTNANYNNTTPPPLHTYANAGTYQIKISGRLVDLIMSGSGDSELSIKKIIQWGDLGIYNWIFSGVKNMTSIPNGAITGYANSNRGTKFNDEYQRSVGIQIRKPWSLEELPTGFTEFIKYEDTGFSFSFRNHLEEPFALKEIPEDFLDGLRITSVVSFFRRVYGLETLPKNLLSNAYELPYFEDQFLTDLGSNNLGDPNKTLILDENFLSNIRVDYRNGDIFKNWNINSVPENIFKNSLSSIENGGTGKINLTSTFYGCSKLTSLPDNIFKDFQIESSCSSMIRGTSITHVKSSWFGGTVQSNDLNFDSFAYGSLVDTIDEDFFTFAPNVTNFDQAFIQTMLVGFPTNTFRNLPKVTNYEQCFSNTPLASIPTDAFKESTLVLNARYMFSGADLLTIPNGLFDTWTIVENFERVFGGTFITSIPNGLFDNNTEVNTFKESFYDCESLASIPNGLFDNNTEVTNFEAAFQDCHQLVSVHENLLINNLKVTTVRRMFRSCVKSTTILKINHLSLLENANSLHYNNGTQSENTITIPFDYIQGLSNLKDASYMLYQFQKVPNNSGSISGAYKLPNTFFDGCLSLENVEDIWSNGNVFIELEGLTLPTSLKNLRGLIWNDGGKSFDPLYQDIPNILEGNNNELNLVQFCWRTTQVTGFIYRYWLDQDLSFSDTTNAFGDLPNALNYPEIPISWGGTNDGSITRLGFYIDTTPFNNSGEVQNGAETSWLVHNGLQEEPQIGDTVYQDYEPSTDVFIGLDQYYAIREDKWIRINNLGVVTQKGN